MGIVNRRNAFVGWVALAVGKRVVKKKAKGVAKEAIPSVDPHTKKPNKGAVALLAAGVVGAITFWRKRFGSGEDTESGEA
jgi:hypothetical protein